MFSTHHRTWRAWHLRQPRRPVPPWLFNVRYECGGGLGGWSNYYGVPYIRYTRLAPSLFFSAQEWFHMFHVFFCHLFYSPMNSMNDGFQTTRTPVSTTLCQLLTDNLLRTSGVAIKHSRKRHGVWHHLGVQSWICTTTTHKNNLNISIHSIPHHLSVSLNLEDIDKLIIHWCKIL